MNIDEHNEKAFEEVLQLAKDNDIAAEDAELKYLDSEYPRFKDASDKKGGTSGYLKILSDEDGRIHWIMAKSYHEELGEVIWRSDGLHSLSTEEQEGKLDELKKLQSQRDEQLQLQLAENR
ncbi:hypothetical protein C9426_35740 [Serratia sp. S1B]|nr:hypothetical protein C9426_35740 [Serratia sp. S1B]